MSELTEPTNGTKSVAESSCQLDIPFAKNSELSVITSIPLKQSTSIKLNRKTGGIFNNQIKNIRSVSSLNQPVIQTTRRRPKTISTINDKCMSTTKIHADRKFLVNSLPKCNSVVSLCSTPSLLHKPGTIPSYLKGESKSSVESEFAAKFRKFKSEKKKLHGQQVYLKKEYNDLKQLKQKLLNLGGKELKLDEINFIDLDSDGRTESKMPLKCEGTAIELGKKDIDLSLVNDIESQIYKIREGDMALRSKFLKASADILENLNRIQDEDVRRKCLQCFRHFEDHTETFKNVETETKELLSQNLIRLKKDFFDAATESSVSKMLNDQRSKILELQIDNNQLKKQVDDLGKKLKLSEQHLKAQETQKREFELLKEATNKQHEERASEIEKLKSKLKTGKLVEDKMKKEADSLRSDVLRYELETVKLRAELNRYMNELAVSEQKSFEVSEKLRLYENRCVSLQSQLDSARDETSNENERLCQTIKELQSNTHQRDYKVTSLQHIFKQQDTDNAAKEFNDAMDGIKELRGGSCESYRLESLKDELNSRCMDLTDQNETFAAIRKLLLIRDNLLASMRNE